MKIIKAHWPAPASIHTFSTTRHGGVSQSPFDTLNLAKHVGDDEAHVIENRARLKQHLHLPAEPLWLNQTHSIDVCTNACVDADASYTQEKNRVLVVMTADCLPLLLCNRAGTEIAAVHAGWRGLANGVVENTVKHFQSPAEDILVWLGPGIGPEKFEVGQDVVDAFTSHDIKAKGCFKHLANEKYLCDAYALAKQRLHALGIQAIYGGEHCTMTEKSDYFSYRRDQTTGRMAHGIWINA